MLSKDLVLTWEEVQHDLFTDDDGRVFGVELDLFNGHMNFYERFPDDSELPIMVPDVFEAIEIFNRENLGITEYN